MPQVLQEGGGLGPPLLQQSRITITFNFADRRDDPPLFGGEPVRLFSYWVQQRGLWVIGDALMILIGVAIFIYSLVHLLT